MKFTIQGYSEPDIENLLIWWGQALNSDPPIPSISDRELVCGTPDYHSAAYLEGSTPPWDIIRAHFGDSDIGYRALLEIGDVIEYLGDGKFIHTPHDQV